MTDRTPPRRLALALLTACAPAALAGCTTSGTAQTAQSAQTAQVVATLDPQWSVLGPRRFEALVAALPSEPSRWGAPALEELTQALDQAPQTAARAAVLLAHATAPAAQLDAEEAFRARLERCIASADRSADAVDVLAASFLAQRCLLAESAGGLRAALAALALEPDAHPDLEVRVECAVGALEAGELRVVPFLLRVLRIGTPDGELDGQLDPQPWARTRTSTWARGRAAWALKRAADGACAYSTESGFEDRDRAARCFEQHLLGPR